MWELTCKLEIPALVFHFIGCNPLFPEGFTTSYSDGWHIQQSERKGAMETAWLYSDLIMIIFSIKSIEKKRLKGIILGEELWRSVESKKNYFS